MFDGVDQYITILLIAYNYNDAKNKFISKCLEKYDEIKILVSNKCCNDDYYEEIVFENISDLEKYLIEKINNNKETIECLETCYFEIDDRYN